MKMYFLILFLVLIIVSFAVYFFMQQQKGKIISPLSEFIEKPLDKYTFTNLKNKQFQASGITIGEVLKQEDGFISYLFYFNDQGEKSLPAGRQVSGLMNLPAKAGIYPVIVMFRGFVPMEKYTTGEGTRHAGEVLAQNGFITLAPDFLGYGQSASPSANSIEERFQTYTTALSLLASIKNLNKALENIQCNIVSQTNKSQIRIPARNATQSVAGGSKLETMSNDQNLNNQNCFENLKIRILNLFGISNLGFRIFPIFNQTFASTQLNQDNCIKNPIRADTEKIGIWGHSNGGHIALSILEITGKNYPTVLWAPVSKPFPYSILYYTDEFDDHGKALRKAVADFEKDYDIEKYSPTNYLSWINAPIQLHQGGDDEAVPQKWSGQLYAELKKLNKEIAYRTYPNEDHNFSQGNWPLAIERSINFYKDHLRQ